MTLIALSALTYVSTRASRGRMAKWRGLGCGDLGDMGNITLHHTTSHYQMAIEGCLAVFIWHLRACRMCTLEHIQHPRSQLPFRSEASGWGAESRLHQTCEMLNMGCWVGTHRVFMGIHGRTGFYQDSQLPNVRWYEVGGQMLYMTGRRAATQELRGWGADVVWVDVLEHIQHHDLFVLFRSEACE